MSVPEIVHQLADLIAGPSKARRWRLVTGLTGWGAAIAFVAWLVTSILGFSQIAAWFIGIAVFLFPIADRLLHKRS